VLGRAVVAAHSKGEAFAVAALALVDDVEQAVQSIHATIVPTLESPMAARTDEVAEPASPSIAHGVDAGASDWTGGRWTSVRGSGYTPPALFAGGLSMLVVACIRASIANEPQRR
jgi:hypothetical protein